MTWTCSARGARHPATRTITRASATTWRRSPSGQLAARGPGTQLISLLAEAGLARGIRAFTASYLAKNRPVAALVKDAGGLHSQVIRQGIAEFSIALERNRAASQTASPPGT